MVIEQGLEWRARPGSRMHPVGDGINFVVREHVAGHLAVLFGNTIDIVAEIEGQVGHVQLALAAEEIMMPEYILAPQGMGRHFQGKAVVTGWHRRVCGKDALIMNGTDIVVIEFVATEPPCTLVQQFEREEGGVPLIHMEARNIMITQSTKHPHPPDTQYDFLAESIPAVTAIQLLRQLAVPRAVLGQIGIEE
jgi:hypothetical protein